MKIFTRTVVSLLLILSVRFIYAQQRGNNTSCEIKGVVTDIKDIPLVYANVYLKESMEGTISNEKGKFNFTSRAAGKLTLICSYIGYEKFTKNLSVKPGKVISLSIKLKQKRIKTRPVSVTASSFTAADKEGVTLTAMDVVRTPGAAADLFWAIKTFPGVQQVEEGAGLFVRGGDVSETAVYLDGALINHPYKYESPTGGFFGTFSPFLLKGTFFSSGGFSAQYGSALSGVLSMESQDLPDRKRIGFGVGLAAESIYLTLPFIDNKFGLSLSGNLSNTKMMFELNNTRKDFSRYPFSYDFNLNTVYKLSNQSSLKFFIFREDDKVGVQVDDPDYCTYFNGNSSNQLYNLRFKSLIAKKFLLMANLAFTNFRRSMHLSVMDLKIENRLYQGRVVCEKEISDDLRLRAGVVFFRNQSLITGTVPHKELDLNPYAEVKRVDTDYISNRTAQFFECDVFGPLGLKVTPGLRGEYESISNKYDFNPRLSLSFPVTSSSYITAAWGHYSQFPEPRYYDPYIGNPDLSTMKASHRILGYVYQKKSRIFRVETYYKRYKNLLLKDDEKNYVNSGHGYARGIDIFIKDSFGHFSGWIAYSWLKARRKWMDIPVVASPYFDITNNLTMMLNADLCRQFTLGLSFRYATGKPYTPAPEQYNKARVPDYQKVDMSLSYLHSFFEGNMTVFYAAVSNLFGKINIFDYRYSDDWERRDAVESSFGRSVYFGVSVNM